MTLEQFVDVVSRVNENEARLLSTSIESSNREGLRWKNDALACSENTVKNSKEKWVHYTIFTAIRIQGRKSLPYEFEICRLMRFSVIFHLLRNGTVWKRRACIRGNILASASRQCRRLVLAEITSRKSPLDNLSLEKRGYITTAVETKVPRGSVTTARTVKTWLPRCTSYACVNYRTCSTPIIRLGEFVAIAISITRGYTRHP